MNKLFVILVNMLCLSGFVWAQNVGVGNTNPQHPLSVGEVTTDNQLVNFRSYSNIGGSWKGGGAFGYTQSTVILGELGGKAHLGGHNNILTAWDDLFINSGGGNVGIGVSSISGVKFEVGGTSKFSGQMDLSGYKLVNLATPTAGTDGVNKDYVDNNDDWDRSGSNLFPKSHTTTLVGIGTNTPTGKLHVAGTHLNGILQDANDRPSVGITGVYPQLVLMSGNSSNANHGATIMLGGYDSGNSGTHKHWSIGTAGAGSSFLDIGYYAGTDLNPHGGIRNHNSSTLMTILSNGNVGIGNTGPTYKLDVTGNTRTTGRFYGRYYLWDTRSVNASPNTYSYEMALEFKERSAIGAPGTSTYGGLMTIAPWGDNSGGFHHQLFFNDQGIAYRTGQPASTTWNGWGQLLTTAGGTANYIPKYNAAGSLSNSSLYDNGNIGLGTTIPAAALHLYQDRYTLYGPNTTWGAYLQVGGNGRVTTHASVAATNGNLHLDAADGAFATYINYYSVNNTLINSNGGGLVGIGATAPSHKLHINSTVNNNTVRLTHNSGVSGAKLNFGDAEYVYLHEYTDDNLWLKANSVALQGYLYPQGAGSYNCGNGSNYFYTVYADDHNYKGVWGYTFDTYDDLELLDNIESETYYDEALQHNVMIMKPESLPKCITNYDDPDYNPSEPFISVKKTNGLLIGAIRQLNREGKERDSRLTERTDIMAEVLGINFDNTSGMATKTISDFGSYNGSSSTEVVIKFSDDFIAENTNGATPVVQITPLGSHGKYYITNKTPEGFTLVLDEANADFGFDWTAMAKVQVSVNGQTDHLNDVFYKEPIDETASYPTLNIPSTLVVPAKK